MANGITRYFLQPEVVQLIFGQSLTIMTMEQSMSRKGDCRDNAPTERFFRSLKHEQLSQKPPAKPEVFDF